MILTTKLHMEKSRVWPDRPLAMIKLDIKKAFDQLYRSKVAPSLEAAGVALEVALRLVRQMTSAKMMPVVGGRCCQEVPLGTWNSARQTGVNEWTFVLVLCFCLGLLMQRMYDQRFCVDIGGNPLAAWGYADDLFLGA